MAVKRGHVVAVTLLLGTAAGTLGTAVLAPDESDPCMGFHDDDSMDKGQVGGWIHDQKLRRLACEKQRNPVQPKTVEVNLDDPPEHRWDAAAAQFPGAKSAIEGYIDSYVPHWAIKPLLAMADKLDSYKGFTSEYAAEMRGLSRALNVSLGYVTIANLIYQLEPLGVNCSAWNTTGPNCPPDVPSRPVPSGLESTPSAIAAARADGPGMCTGIVAGDEMGGITHGRNLDWNLDPKLLPYVIDVRFTRGGETVFVGTTLVSFVGILHGMVPGVATVSMNARNRGGSMFETVLEMLFKGAATPAQHLRSVLEGSSASPSSYDAVVTGLQNTPLVNEVYYIVGGTTAEQGAVVTRDRKGAHDTWYIDPTESDGWYRLETNYDHEDTVPAADDRRDPGMAAMNQLGGPTGVNETSIRGVMLTWPVFNFHTDITAVMSARNGLYKVVYWMPTTLATEANQS